MELNENKQPNQPGSIPARGKTRHTIELSDHFTAGKLLRFALPSIAMMLFTSIYGVVDGYFISNYVSESAFASVNLIIPYYMIFAALGSVFGVGGSALVALIRGEGRQEESNRVFTMLILSLAVISVVCGGIAQIFLPRVTVLLGATENLYHDCIIYGRITLATMPVFLMQYAFQSFMVTAERPKVGLVIILCAGVTNMVLDWLFIAIFRWGVAGAAIATSIGQLVGGAVPIIYIARAKDLPLKFVKTRFMPHMLGRAITNGLADGFTNIAMSVSNMVYNLQLMHYLGEYGVSAYGVIMYVNFFFVSVYLGYAIGVAPIYSYNRGADNRTELKNVFTKSALFITVATVLLTALAELGAGGIAAIFTKGDAVFQTLSTHALRLYSLSYILAGYNILVSSMFAALNNGWTAGILSLLRTLVFQLLAVLILPKLIGSDGIWLAIVAAEILIFIVSAIVWKKNRPKYGY